MERFGTFSSSNMWKLMTNNRNKNGLGAPAEKYIKQVRYERFLGRAINSERDSRPTSWGKFIESRVFNLLGFDYRHVSDQRLVHPDFHYWTGAPDLFKDSDTVCDVKCPVSHEVFCDKLEALKDIEVYKVEFPDDYYQHVSNSILSGRKFAEAIIYMPYRSELEEIREAANKFKGNQNKIAWINWAEDDEMPYLIDGGNYKNLNVVRFEVPQADKDALTERVKLAGTLLEKREIKEAA